MGLLDGLANQLLSQISGGQQHSSLLPHVLELLQGGNGPGVQGLMNSFKSNGLDDVLSSWISTGQNLPISGAQIEKVLGGNVLEQLAAKTGTPMTTLSSQLSNLLPQVIDKLTPNGALPAGGDLLGGLFKSKLF